MKRIPYPTPKKEDLESIKDTKGRVMELSSNNEKKIFKIDDGVTTKIKLDVESAAKLMDELIYFLGTNSNKHDAMRVPRRMPDTIFNILLVEYKTIFRQAREEMKNYLQWLWDIDVSTRFKEEALWNKKFIELMDSWELEYAKDMEEHGPGLNPEEDEDEEEDNGDTEKAYEEAKKFVKDIITKSPYELE